MDLFLNPQERLNGAWSDAGENFYRPGPHRHQQDTARSLRDAKDIGDERTRREVTLSIGGSVHDSTDPVGQLFFNVLAMVAELEANLIQARTPCGLYFNDPAAWNQTPPPIPRTLATT